jgi:CxxC motif-containing protein
VKETRELICIACPSGCRLKATIEDGKVTEVDGNTCRKGEEYAAHECINPTRILTTTVRINGGTLPVLPVKSERALPKSMIKKSMEELGRVRASAPVNIGDVIVKNISGTGIDIISTRSIKKDPGSAEKPRRKILAGRDLSYKV